MAGLRLFAARSGFLAEYVAFGALHIALLAFEVALDAGAQIGGVIALGTRSFTAGRGFRSLFGSGLGVDAGNGCALACHGGGAAQAVVEGLTSG